MRTKSIIVTLLLLFISTAAVQVRSQEKAKESVGNKISESLWDWTPKSDHHKPIVQIIANGNIGTGTVVTEDGKILTVWHIVESNPYNDNISILFTNGFRSKARAIYSNKDNDIAVLHCAAVPVSIKPAKIASALPAGEELEICGLGGNTPVTSCIRHFKANRIRFLTDDNILCADAPLIPGDSGGPIFNKNHEIVGVVSGGSKWYDRNVFSVNKRKLPVTWPTRSSCTVPEILEAVFNTPSMPKPVESVPPMPQSQGQIYYYQPYYGWR